MLTVDAVVPFLLQRGLIQEWMVADRQLQVVDVSRRNRNFKFIDDGGPGYFLKQGAPGEAARAVAHEAQLYHWFIKHPSSARLAPLLPQCGFYEADSCTLVLELVEEAQSIYEYHWRHRGLTSALGLALGDALGTLHQLTAAAAASAMFEGPVPGRAARYLLLHHPGIEAFTTVSGGSLEVVRLVQGSEEVCGLLDSLNQEWRESCVIHADLRWDNCQVVGTSADVDGPRIQFVDWEMAGLGDPCWDVGTVFSECLSTWLLSTPVTRDTAPGDFLPLARFPLRKMQSAMRSFWRSYVRRMALDDRAAAEWLRRSVQYAGARLIQTAYEVMQREIRLTANVIYMLQLSLNVMERPLEAAAILLSIPTESSVTP
jgi:hypothetical protein